MTWKNRQKREKGTGFSDRRLIEIAYHKKMNIRVATFSAPAFLFFAGFHHYLGNSIQSLIFSTLFINSVASVHIASNLEDLKSLMKLKQVGSAIAFGLLGSSLLVGLMSDDVYLFFPWVFIFPIVVVLFFGEKAGGICALTFCLAATIIILTLTLPPWTLWAGKMIKLNTALSLFSLFSIAIISERTRVRIRNNLLKAQNGYRMAEKRQRETNVELQHEIELRKESEKALTQSEIRYRALFEESAVSLWEEDWSGVKQFMDDLPQEATDNFIAYFLTNKDQFLRCIDTIQVTGVNRSTLTLYGADTTDTLIKNLPTIMPPKPLKFIAERIVALYETGRHKDQVDGASLDQTPLHLLVSTNIPAGFEESWTKVFTSVYDVTEQVAVERERKRVEKKFQNARQIQAIGTLAGGIAHQFNNAIATIKGNLDLLEICRETNKQQLRFIHELKGSTERMHHLTDQLLAYLAYAQGGKYQPKAFSANELIRSMLNSGAVAETASVQICTRLSPDVIMSDGDVTQIRMVLEAVLSNAVESINNYGTVTISTKFQRIDREGEYSDVQLPTGSYSVIEIQDTGVGMDEQTCQRIFEPFFSTKFVGCGPGGRGLGMSAAFGIIRNHNGMITAKSKPNHGTCIKIFLPCLDDRESIVTPEKAQSAA